MTKEDLIKTRADLNYPITTNALILLGFKDESHDSNGLAYSKKLPGGLLEFFWHTLSPGLRFQTVSSGFAQNIKGVDNLFELISLWRLLTGEKLIDQAFSNRDKATPQH